MLDTMRGLRAEPTHVLQPKLDGIRVTATIDCGVPAMWSRNGMSVHVPHSMRKDLVEALECFPGDATLDGELLGAYGRLSMPAFAVWDVTHYAGSWIGTWTYEQRLKLLEEHIPPASRRVYVVSCYYESFLAAFNNLKADESSHVEGVVVKALRSPLAGDRKRSVYNPEWVKVRW